MVGEGVRSGGRESGCLRCYIFVVFVFQSVRDPNFNLDKF